MSYNLSFMDNVTSASDLATGMNDLSSGWLFGMILLTVWIIVLVSVTSRGRPIGETMLSSSLIVAIIGGVMLGGGYISPWILSFPAIGILAGVILLINGK